MATVHVRADTPVPPERIRAALTDFTDRRPDYWPNLDRNRYQVHATGDTCKLVTLAEVDAIVTVVRRLLPGLTDRDGVDLIAAAAAMSGAFWQMATPRA